MTVLKRATYYLRGMKKLLLLFILSLLFSCAKDQPDSVQVIRFGPEYYRANCYEGGFPKQWNQCMLTHILRTPDILDLQAGSRIYNDSLHYDVNGHLDHVFTTLSYWNTAIPPVQLQTDIIYDEACSKISVYQDIEGLTLATRPLRHEYIYKDQRLVKWIIYTHIWPDQIDTSTINYFGYRNGKLGGIISSTQGNEIPSLLELDDFGNIAKENIDVGGSPIRFITHNYTFFTQINNPFYQLPYPLVVRSWMPHNPKFMKGNLNFNTLEAWASQSHGLPDSSRQPENFPAQLFRYTYHCP